MEPKQPPLFGEDLPPNLGEIARQIAESAPKVDYPDRTSEAARDQGWGPVDTPTPPTPPKPRNSAERRQAKIERIQAMKSLLPPSPPTA